MIDYDVSAQSKDAVVLSLRGDMTGERSVDEMHEALREHYVDDGVRVIRADLSEVRTISLEGVATLLSLWRESRRRGKRFTVTNATGQVADKLAVTGVLGMLEEGS